MDEADVGACSALPQKKKTKSVDGARDNQSLITFEIVFSMPFENRR
jgi:hypothetical protein